MDDDLIRGLSALPKIANHSSPARKQLAERLHREARGWLIKHGYEKSDYELPTMDFTELAGESLIDSLREDPTWLTYYRRTKDA